MITEQIWHHQTAELPPVIEHPHRRRVLASLYASCGVLGLVIGVTVAEVSAAAAPIPPAAVAMHPVTGPGRLTVATKRPTASAPATTSATATLKVASVPVKAKSARVVVDDPTPTLEPTTEAPTPEPSDDPPVMVTHSPSPEPTIVPSFPPGPPT